MNINTGQCYQSFCEKKKSLHALVIDRNQINFPIFKQPINLDSYTIAKRFFFFSNAELWAAAFLFKFIATAQQ